MSCFSSPNLFFTLYTIQCASHLHSLSTFSGYASTRSNMITSWCLDRHSIASRSLARRYTHLCIRLTALRAISACFLNCETLCGDMLRMCAVLANILFYQQRQFFLVVCGHRFSMTSWVCQWKPFWIPVGDTIQKAYLEEWQRVDDGSKSDPGEYSLRAGPFVADSRRHQRAENSDCVIKYEQPLDAQSAPKSSWQAVGEPGAPTWKLSGTEGTSAFWGNRTHHCPSRNVYAILLNAGTTMSRPTKRKTRGRMVAVLNCVPL